MSLGLLKDSLNSYRQYIFLSVYGCEAVIPLEIQTLSPRVILTTKMTDRDNHRLCL